ncbi:hypothetical protein [Streptomyces cathayae]|uniref:AAA+ ATPase domain-containing protein n=1 Tax=Streptomyces cathayae TaxID=3031124 RepID=A0ABY8JU55_9ACTN|nr:hypothetical protein [Streptomyces sp. HUAS 5]WGD39512.1 hypothetical protein PYS65_04805 [Streptomyces sp. HUAS 5]
MTLSYPVVAEPPFSPPDAPVELLKELASALEGFGPVVDTILGQLTVEDMGSALNSLHPKDRRTIMRNLNFRNVQPRSFGRVLGEEVLKRVRRLEPAGERRHATSHLTERIWTDVIHEAVAHAVGHDGADPAERWGTRLVRLALFSRLHASVFDAHIVTRAAEHHWYGLEAAEATREAVHEAARRVIEAAPDFQFVPDLQEDGDDGEPTEDAVQAVAVPAPRPPLGTPESEPDMKPEAEYDTLHDLDSAEEELRSVVDKARDAVDRIRLTLLDGRPPGDPDLASLEAVVPAFARAQAMLEALDVTGVGDRLDDLLAAVGAFREASERNERNDRARGAAETVLTLGCPPDSAVATVIADARQRAAGLLAKEEWSEDDEASAELLTLLVRLVELKDRPDSPQMLVEVQQKLSLAHPSYAVAAVLHDQITVTATEPSTGPQPANETFAERREDHQAGPVREPRLEDASVAVDANEVIDAPGSEPGAHAPEPPAAPSEPSVTDSREAEPHTVTAIDVASGTRPQDVEPVLARLIVEKRFGLAAHLSRTAGRPDAEATVLRLSAASELLNPRSDQAARFVEDSLREWDAQEDAAAGGLELLLLPVLVQTALVTGAPVAGAQLRALSQHLPETLQQVAAEVAECTLNSALLLAPLQSVVADASQLEGRLQHAVEACRNMLVPPRMRFQRASQMVKQWLLPNGLFGSVLTAVVNDAADAADRADALLKRLDRPTQIEDEIDRMDAGLRGTGGRAIHGSGRNNVRQFVERVRAAVWEWHTVQRELGSTRSEETAWAAESVAGLRRSLLGLRKGVMGDLATAGRRSHPVARAAAAAAGEMLEAVFDQLESGAAPVTAGAEADVSALLDIELYKLSDWPHGPLTVSALLEAVDRTWEDAIGIQTVRDGFTAVRTILRLAELGALPAAQGLELSGDRITRLAQAEKERHTALAEHARTLGAELRRAQADGALTDEQDVSLQELLADATPRTESGEPRELSAIRRNLDRVAELLPHYRKEAADRLRARLAALPDVREGDRSRVLHNLETDSLATAAELVYFLELGESVPEIRAEDPHLKSFFPAVPAVLPDGITPELISAVRSRGRFGDAAVLDYSILSDSEAERAAGALERWRKLASARDRANINAREDLNPALSLLGFEARRARPLDDLPRRQDYRFFELVDTQVTGRAWAPAFGSQIKDRGNKLRVLLIWGRPAAKLLISRVALDPDESSLLVVHFGTLDNRTRTELAAASRGTKPLLVVDDAALAYLTAHGNRRVDAATETLLPFSGVNPYIKEKRGQIGREMFYGRDRERRSILDPTGTQIIYGGRGLGKSALLADAGDRFVEQQPEYRKLYLNLDKIGIGKGTALGAAAIWTTLDQELIKEGVLEEPRRRGPKLEPWQRVTDGIATWLEQDADRRLLILLDECDRFFEADVPDCTETRRLRGLGEDSRGRAKVVFAGLHSVQRFTRLARNGPFSHLAQTPTVVGPLTPQFAADLIVRPMRALGFEFADVDLVNRVLGFCSYQPFLLQIFGSRMVQVMQDKRARQPLTPPPYTIQASDVDEVEQDPSLRSDINAAFKDTLALDDRYNVVANVLAQHARENGLETRLSDRELRDECAGWWPQGFAKLDSEGFRAYLQEMVGLGVLAPNHDGQGWHLRGPNALRMIGTAQEIEMRLLGAEREYRLEETVVLESRPGLDDGRRSAPLTINQIDFLLGTGGNQVRVVVGTRATGIGDVQRTLRDATGRVAGWTLPPIGNANTYRRELVAGRAGERRLLISDLGLGSDKSCRDSLSLARTDLPTTSGATRSVVLVSSMDQLGFWRDLLDGPEPEGEGSDDTAVVLRRYDLRGLRDWTQYHSAYETEERLAQLAAVTGGWPVLLDRVLELRETHRDQDRAVRELAEWLGHRDGAHELVEAVGLLRDDAGATDDPDDPYTMVRIGYDAIVEELGTGWNSDAYCETAVELAGLAPDDARWALTCLETLQVFDRDGTRLRVEPVLHAALGIVDAGK